MVRARVGAASWPGAIGTNAIRCQPTPHRLAPEAKKADQQLQGEAVVLKVNAEEHPRLAACFGVCGIPMFAVIDHGQVKQEQAGLVDARRLVAMVLAG